MVESETYPWFGVFGNLNSYDQLSVTRLVEKGGAIEGAADEIMMRLKRTRKLALLRVEGTDRIVGVAALKTPNQWYRADTFAAAGVSIFGYETASELGYVVIAKEMQGRRLSGGLVDAIAMSIRETAFATTDSNTMRNNLRRSGFTRVGQEWLGQKGALSLWTINPLCPDHVAHRALSSRSPL